ncbi:MAG: endonuclease domain-containing protein [Pseudomonadota bacterium]
MSNGTARRLRKQQTEAEQRLWKHLRNRRFCGYKFRRQAPIGRYVVDFVCISPKIVIEVDGGQHALRVNEDMERTRYLESLGYCVIRFWNTDVLRNIESILEVVQNTVNMIPSPQPSPEGRGGNAEQNQVRDS